MNPEQLQSLAVLAFAMVPVAMQWWALIRMLAQLLAYAWTLSEVDWWKGCIIDVDMLYVLDFSYMPLARS